MSKETYITDKLGSYKFTVIKKGYSINSFSYTVFLNNCNILELITVIDSEMLLQALYDLTKPILNSKIRDEKTNYKKYLKKKDLKKYLYSMKNVQHNILGEAHEFLENLNTITTDNMIKLLLLLDKVYVKDKDSGVNVNVDELVQVYKKRINNGLQNISDDFIQADNFRPYLSDLTVNEILYITDKNFLYNKDVLKKLAIYNIIINDPYIDDSIFVKDYVIHEDYVIKCTDFTTLIQDKKKFEQYVSNLSIGDFKRLNKEMCHHGQESEKQMINFAKEIVKNKNIVFDDKALNDSRKILMNNVVDFNDETKLTIDYIFQYVKMYEDYSVYVVNSPIFSKLINDYVLSKKSFTNNDVDRLYDCLVDSTSHWIKNQGLAEYVLYKLNSIMSVNEILDVIEGVNNNEPLTANQWDNIIDDYDDYEKIPVSLWKTLL